MKKYIIKLNGEIENLKYEYDFLGTIFEDFHLIKCTEETYLEMKNDSRILSIQEDEECKSSENPSPANLQNDITNVTKYARNFGFLGEGINIAIIDSGINYNHENLQINIIRSARIIDTNIISTDNLSNILDDGGHGTAVASVLAGQGVNGGFYGVAPNANYIIIKGNVATNNQNISNSTIATSIIWATDNGANIINVSYTQSTYVAAVDEACRYARDRGVIVFAPSGNNGVNSLTNGRNSDMWVNYTSPVIIGGCISTPNLNGKSILPLPDSVYRYTHALIYYSDNNRRYRLLLSQQPIFISVSSTSGSTTLNSSPTQEYWDYSPENSVWQLTSTNSNNTVSLAFAESDEAIRSRIVYNNNNIEDRRSNGIFQTPIPLSFYHEHIVQNFSNALPDYNPDDLTNVIRDPRSSYGKGIDFVGPFSSNVAVVDNSEGYRVANGTSFSTPYVAGVYALVKQRFPNFSHDEIYDYLKQNALKIGNRDDKFFGNGLVSITDFNRQYINSVYNRNIRYRLKNILPILD